MTIETNISETEMTTLYLDGKGSSLNGTASYIEVPNDLALSLNKATGMTISIYFCPDTVDFPTYVRSGCDNTGLCDAYIYLLGKIAPQNNEYALRMFNLHKSDRITLSSRPQRISAYIFDKDYHIIEGSGTYVQEPFVANERMNIIYVFDSDYTYIYKNGIFKRCARYTLGENKAPCTSDVHAGIATGSGSAPLLIGTTKPKKDGYSDEGLFQGSIIEVRFYKKNYTNTDIADLHNHIINGTDYDPTNAILFHNYRLGNAIDQTGNGHNGILRGNAIFRPLLPSLDLISIDPTKVTLAISAIQQLSYTCKDSSGNTMICPDINWSSDNTLVATVDPSGKVTGVLQGNANIIASSGNVTSNISTITVNPPSYILQLDGYGDYVNVPDSNFLSLDRTKGLTVSILFRPDTLNFPVTISSPNGSYIWIMGKNFPNNNREYGLRIYNKNSSRPNYISSILYQLDKQSGIESTIKEPVSIGDDINIVFVFSSINVYIFKDGIFKGCDMYTSTLSADCNDNSVRPIYPKNGTAPLRIGTAYTKSDGFNSESFFKGGIKDIRMYARKFSKTDVASLHNSVKSGVNNIYKEYLVFWHNYRLGNAIDQSGRGHNGILYGNAKFISE